MSIGAASKILVGIDFSSGSDEALRQADQWARASKSSLVVLHCLPHPPGLLSFPRLHPAAGQELTEVIARAKSATIDRVCSMTGRSESEFSVIVDAGPADEGIAHKADELKAGLIVVGASGASGVRKILGGTVERVVRYASISVLVTRSSPATDSVLVATDFSESSLPAVEAAGMISGWLNAKLTLLHNIDTPAASMYAFAAPTGNVWAAPPPEVFDELRQASRTMLETIRERYRLSANLLVTEGNAAHEIVHAAESSSASLVIVGTRGKTGLRRLVLGSVAEKVVSHTVSSTLVIRH